MTSWSRRRLSAAVAILFVIVAAMFAFFVVRSRLQEPATVIVYLKDVPYCDFLGHVVQSQGRIRLVKEYPLWDDDLRDGIWSARCWVSPMEKINFAFDTQSSDRHGIIMYSFDSRWLEHQPATWSITWFDSRNAVPRDPGKLLWDLRQGQTNFLSSDEAIKLGIKEVTECAEEIAQVRARNAAVFARATGAWDATRTTDTLGVLAATVGGSASPFGPGPLVPAVNLTAAQSSPPSVVLMPPIGGLELYRRGRPPFFTSGRE